MPDISEMQRAVDARGQVFYIAADGTIYTQNLRARGLIEAPGVRRQDLTITGDAAPKPRPTPEVTAGMDTEDRAAASSDQLAELGLPTEPGAVDLASYLSAAGVDTEAPELQLVLPTLQQRLEDPNDTQIQALLPMLAQSMAEKYPSTPQTAYSTALAASGFTDPFPAPEVSSKPSAIQGIRRGGRTGLTAQELDQARPQTISQPRFETEENTGWIRFSNDVLVDPSSGEVYYKPGSNAPGSPWWQQKITREWGPDKVGEWRDRLHKLGYITSDQAKVKTIDSAFLAALAQYHQQRYLNGGKPVAGDLAANGPGGASEPKPVNLHDFGAQIRNDVREQYKRVYGVDPSDGEVQAWSDYVMRTGMSLQRKFIRKYGSANTDTAATEAEERFVEKIEQSPEGRFLAEADEENTRLRDTMERMAMVTNSLAS